MSDNNPMNIFGDNDLFMQGTMDDLPSKDAGKRVLVLFIVDATRSMEGAAIGQVNCALGEMLSDLRTFSSNNHLNMDIAVMSFSNSVAWELQPQDINQCYGIPQIVTRPGQTQYGVVYNELNKMLNKDNLLRCTGKQSAPVIIFMTDGAPVDDYKYDLEMLKQNGYFMLSSRSAIIMGEAANEKSARDAVSDFTMNSNMILTTKSLSNVVKDIKLTTLHTLKKTDIPDHQKSNDVFQPVGDTDTFQPVGDTDTFPPVGDMDTFPPVGDTDTFPPVGDTDTFPPVGDTDTFQPVGDTDTFPPVGDTDTFPPIGDTDPFPSMGDSDSFPSMGDTDPFPAMGDTDPFPAMGDTDPFPSMGDSDPFPAMDDTDPFQLIGGTDPITPTGGTDPFPSTDNSTDTLDFGDLSALDDLFQ